MDKVYITFPTNHFYTLNFIYIARSNKNEKQLSALSCSPSLREVRTAKVRNLKEGTEAEVGLVLLTLLYHTQGQYGVGPPLVIWSFPESSLIKKSHKV